MAYQTIRQEYLQIPVVTRSYATACVLTTAAVVSKKIEYLFLNEFWALLFLGAASTLVKARLASSGWLIVALARHMTSYIRAFTLCLKTNLTF